MASLTRAIEVIHDTYRVPHIILTSVSLDTSTPSSTPTPTHTPTPPPPPADDSDDSEGQSKRPTTTTLSVIGSTMTSDRRPRAFKIRFPALDAYFSGTGDMFGALMVVRMREAVTNGAGAGANKSSSSLGEMESWLSPDDVDALDLPLAKAAEKVLASMHEVLDATCKSMQVEVEKIASEAGGSKDDKRMHLARSKAAELKLVRHLGSLRDPKVEFKAQRM